MASISALGIGSGMDLNGLLDQLAAAERQKLQPITQQKQAQQAKISAYGRLENALSTFQDSAAKLSKPETFQGVSSAVAGASVSAAASSTAPIGSYQVNVIDRAESYSIATNGVASQTDNLGGGTLSFTMGNGDALSVDINPAESSLQDIRDAINSSNGGVQASIVNDGSNTPYRLVLSSLETGTDAAITNIDFGTLGADLGLDAATEQQAQNAMLNVNGITITSQSNRVEGAIQGVTLDLQEEGSSTVSISRDTELTEKAVTDFVDKYNNLQTLIGNLTRFGGESGSNGQLLGDSTLRSVQQNMRNILGEGVGEGNARLLSDVGIDLGLDGKLTLDEAKLNDLTANNMNDLNTFFAGTTAGGGLSGKIDVSISQLLQSDGPIKNTTQGLQDSIGRLDDRFLRMEESIEKTIDRYRSQFSQLDSMIANMNSTSNYLTQQFDIMNAQLGRN
ncbi:flagellar hook protein [Aliidiomarina iranensis]|uniref:Flagellar hook-associated protein 2 n=1 Tax=Aliidiomarina iranensis TaxID=1434071 RepID=A0A432W1W5_9GAMM|nr:flagellar filament capping protein FliD [Aliidiomarina iranensis]RUO23214.1 flagellar hook protein [Aliidiomarina iranensis]